MLPSDSRRIHQPQAKFRYTYRESAKLEQIENNRGNQSKGNEEKSLRQSNFKLSSINELMINNYDEPDIYHLKSKEIELEKQLHSNKSPTSLQVS